MRSRKLKMLEKQFDQFTAMIEEDPASMAGAWAERYLPGAHEVRLDLGCGKGSFDVRSAALEPDVLFVGMDCERGCVAMAAKRALATGVRNVVFTAGDGDDVARYFAPGELGMVYLNFSTPNTPAKMAPKRLTYADRLVVYRDLLKPGGAVRFKTDSAPFFDFSLTQFELAGYDVRWLTRDLHAFNPDEVQSEYEEMLSEMGASIHALLAVPGPLPEVREQTAPMGLVSYLPEDLDSMTYIPYGMEDTVRNLKNYAAKQAKRAKAAERAAAKRAAAERRAAGECQAAGGQAAE